LLLAPHKKKAGEETKYGMGWFIGKSKSGQSTDDGWKGEDLQSIGEVFEK